MAIRDELLRIADDSYDRKGAATQPIFSTLARLASEVALHCPAHYETRISRGVGGLPTGLWVAILDPDVTDSPTRGVYAVWLFSEDRTRVSLSLNQGTTQAESRARSLPMTAAELLRTEASAIRAELEGPIIAIQSEINLGLSRRVTLYEAGNIAAVTWRMDSLPSERDIVAALREILDLYAQAISAKRKLRLEASPSIHTGIDVVDLVWRPDARFEPKDSSDYRAHIAEHEQVRSRSHEKIVELFGSWARECGYLPNTNVHPRDLTLHGNQREVLVEVKVFTVGRPKSALRECIGQLFEYRHFFGGSPDLMACLSGDPGSAYVELFEVLGIGVCWPEGTLWRGSPRAVQWGLSVVG